MKEFYKFRCEDGDDPSAAELLIFAAIGDWEDMGEVSAKAFAHELSKLPASVKRLDIHINSPGGSLFEASAIYSRLADHRSKKVVYVDGLAASAASIVAMVGHKIYIRSNANIMVHLPSGIVMGNADDMRKMAGALDTVTESMINIYTERTGLNREEVRNMLAAETWMDADSAVENGFADEKRGVVKAAAMVDDTRAVFNGAEFDLSRFHNIPAFTASRTKGKTMPKATKPKTAAGAPPDADEEEQDQETPTPPETQPPEEEQEQPPLPATQTIPKKPAKGTENDYDRGVEAERARVSALQKLDKPATHEIVVKAIAEGKQAGDIAADCIEAMSRTQAQGDRRTDARVLDGIPPSDGGEDENQFGTLLKTKVQARLKARGQRVPLNSRN
jgi:ATP-dependent Clp protease protease subunit